MNYETIFFPFALVGYKVVTENVGLCASLVITFHPYIHYGTAWLQISF